MWILIVVSLTGAWPPEHIEYSNKERCELALVALNNHDPYAWRARKVVALCTQK